MNEHPIRELFESYVMGAIGDLDKRRLESHVLGCVECADKLADEARTELALFAIAGRAERCPACRRACVEARCGHCGAARMVQGYRTRAVLAQNASGRIYVADAPDGTRVALKELVFTLVPDMRAVEAFEREGRVLRQLDHPRIPRYIDSFIDGDGVHMRFYLAQSYVQGDSLADRMENHRFNEAEVRDIAQQVLTVLVYLQSLSPQVVHRDLKPSNLIQRPDEAIVLVDFGSARERGATTRGTFAGTFGYAPSEQLVGIVDGTSDLYALGATLLHLLTRAPPTSFAAPNLSKANVSPALKAWLEKMIAIAPSDRFQSAEQALTALQHARGSRGWRPGWLHAMAGVAAASITVLGAYVAHQDNAGVQRVSEVAQVEVATSPPGAVVYLDGSQVMLEGSGGEARTPLTFRELVPGKTYQLTLVREGYERSHQSFVAGPVGTSRTVQATLRPRPGQIGVVVKDADQGAVAVFFDGVRVGFGSMDRRHDGGSVRVTATKGGMPCVAMPERVTISPGGIGQTSVVCPSAPDCQFLGADVAPGYATIDTVPHSEIFLSGQRLGDTPLARHKLPAGCVDLVARSKDPPLEKRVRIKVEPNKTQRYRFELE